MTDLLEFLPVQEAVLVEIESLEGVLHSVSGGPDLQVRGKLVLLLVRCGHTTQQTVLNITFQIPHNIKAVTYIHT